ncbi:hypothetical protein AMTRI_Chr07g26070 [Amborella trichopoda]
MAGPVFTSDSNPKIDGDAKVTFYVLVCALISSTGGLMFGYDIGISGGVTAMDDFLEKFFPAVYARKLRAHENNYCKFDSQRLQAFTSSLYLAAMVATFLAAWVCKKYGRRPTMRAASLFFLGGVALTAAAVNLPMLIIGRILLGLGIGFANQAVPLFLSESTPSKWRGSLNILFQLLITVGILIANLVNYRTSSLHPWGWRLSLGLAGVPAALLCFGSLLITEKGKATLERIRGTMNVEPEFLQLVEACEAASEVKHLYCRLMRRDSHPRLLISIILQVFQQLTGINAIMFYAPVLFQTMGFKNDASLLSAVITGTVNAISTFMGIVIVDRVGRKPLLLQAAVQMFICQVAIGIILLKDLHLTNSLTHTVAIVVVILVCAYVAGFAWSWGPLGWLIPSEIFPIETRSAGFSFAVCSNMLFTFLIAQAFLSTLCHLKAGIFFFAMWILLMGTFVVFFLPETKGVPVDQMTERVRKKHWLWARFMAEETNRV